MALLESLVNQSVNSDHSDRSPAQQCVTVTGHRSYRFEVESLSLSSSVSQYISCLLCETLRHGHPSMHAPLAVG
eukprot:scaffold1285_cov112-Isochrysis_galbana.AAC.2